MQELSEVFKDSTELAVARVLAKHIPGDIGNYPFTNATLSGIVWNAISELKRREAGEIEAE